MTELIWDGKYKDGKKASPVRIALPFQTIETVNESVQERQKMLDLFSFGRDPEWRNRLIWGDNKYVLLSLLQEFEGKVDLIAYAKEVEHQETAGPLFSQADTEKRIDAMNASIVEVEQAMETLKEGSPWDSGTKVSERFLPAVFDKYFRKLKLPNVMLKKNYHVLARYISKNKVDHEIKTKLDAIVDVLMDG